MAGKVYFTQETENAIIAYNNSTSEEEKQKLYHTKIHYPFFKLTENIIHTYKFYYTEVENIEDLQHEVICFLLEKMHKFNPEKGAKAYSYFGTIAKNYLILNNNKNYKKKIDSIPSEELHHDSNYAYELDDDGLENDRLSNFLDEYIEYCYDHLIDMFPKPNDFRIADAILTVFEQRDGLDIFNKKAIYIYLREMTEATTPQITRIANKLSNLFQEHYLFYLENGYTNFEKEEYL